MRLLTRAATVLALVGLLVVPAMAYPQNAKQMQAEIDALLRQYQTMGKKGFETRYPDGKPKEKYTVAEDGTVSYAKFFPAGNFAVKYQRKADGVESYERWYGNGKEHIILTRDPRITAYNEYWPTGTNKVKYQRNKEKNESSYVRYDEDGKQIIP